MSPSHWGKSLDKNEAYKVGRTTWLLLVIHMDIYKWLSWIRWIFSSKYCKLPTICNFHWCLVWKETQYFIRLCQIKAWLCEPSMFHSICTYEDKWDHIQKRGYPTPSLQLEQRPERAEGSEFKNLFCDTSGLPKRLPGTFQKRRVLLHHLAIEPRHHWECESLVSLPLGFLFLSYLTHLLSWHPFF